MGIAIDDAAISPDAGSPDVGLDPNVPLSPDPFGGVTTPIDPSVLGDGNLPLTAPLWTPNLSSPTIDPSAVNAHPSTAAPSGNSAFDQVLGVSKIALAGAQIATTQKVASPVTGANKMIAAPTATGAGTGLGILGVLIVLFIAIFAFLEFRH